MLTIMPSKSLAILVPLLILLALCLILSFEYYYMPFINTKFELHNNCSISGFKKYFEYYDIKGYVYNVEVNGTTALACTSTDNTDRYGWKEIGMPLYFCSICTTNSCNDYL